jgi:prolyl 4-hydroxylase
MQQFEINKSNSNPNFIGSWMIEPLSLCKDLITYFELQKEKQSQGMTASGLDLAIKNSTDISITPNEIKLPGNEVLVRYFDALFECHKDYMSQWPFFGEIFKNLEIGRFNLQKYQPGGHFQKLHAERSELSTLHRVLAWMTYLNDVDDGGSTYFEHYKLTIEPRQGLTLIWPAEWTHAHKGNLIKVGSKYIITGWINFSK